MNFFISCQLRLCRQEAIQTGLYFAGAIPGNLGGPRVKVSRLKERFKQKTFGFNVIYVLSNYPYLNSRSINLCKKKGVPIVLNQNGVYFPGWFGPKSSEANYSNRLIYQNCSYVLWQSQFARKASRKFLGSIDPPGEILYNAVDLDMFFPDDKNNSGKLFRFLLAGKFTHQTLYQVEAGVRSFAMLGGSKGLELLVAGLTDSQRSWVRGLASSLGVAHSVHCIGPYSQLEAPRLMRSVDAYLALKHMDTCPNLVIEALASGVPVIYSNSGGTPELVGSCAGIGLYVEENWDSKPMIPDQDSIVEAMRNILDVADRMREPARLRAEEAFDIRDWYKRHEEIFQLVREGSR
jgi:glycosyltransferase involved in cell wall biosynthesis